MLEFDDELVTRIDAAELIEHDSPEEVEIRACAAARRRAARPGPRRTRPRPPSTTSSGTAAASRATRPTHATVPELLRIEGFHALKHALRFGAEIVEVSGDRAEAEKLQRPLAPDITLPDMTPGDELVAFAKQPRYELDLSRPGPIVYLEEPRHMGNLGAAIRVSAAAGAAAVLTTGDPWHVNAIRGAAGLQFALPSCTWTTRHPAAGRCSRSTPRARSAACPATRSSPSGQSVTG